MNIFQDTELDGLELCESKLMHTFTLFTSNTPFFYLIVSRGQLRRKKHARWSITSWENEVGLVLKQRDGAYSCVDVWAKNISSLVESTDNEGLYFMTEKMGGLFPLWDKWEMNHEEQGTFFALLFSYFFFISFMIRRAFLMP